MDQWIVSFILFAIHHKQIHQMQSSCQTCFGSCHLSMHDPRVPKAIPVYSSIFSETGTNKKVPEGLNVLKELFGAGDGNRTHVTSLEGWSSTIELHPPASAVRNSSIPKRSQEEKWSGRRDSDSRHPPWQGGTLPLSYYRTFHRFLSWKAMVRTKRLELLRC